jgi:hypothetical protein
MLGRDCTLEMAPQVFCSFFGSAFWFTSGGGSGVWFQQELAQSMWKNNSPQTQLLPPWNVTPYCSARTTLPDLTAAGIVTNGNGTWQPALTGTNPCERFEGVGLNSGWLCFATLTQTLPVLPTTKPDCSNWDNGYPGKILTNRGGGPQPMNPPKP